MGLLKIQINESEIFVHYQPIPKEGSHLGRVFPGGGFNGVNFEQLLSLGTGEHNLDIDERARSVQAVAPRYASNREKEFANLRYAIFMYEVGACAFSELESNAYEFAGSHSIEDLLAVFPRDLRNQLSESCNSSPQGRKNWVLVESECRTKLSNKKEAIYKRRRRERMDKSYRGYCKVHDYFHNPGNA